MEIFLSRQSTVNPNMPLRDLEYVACLMAALTYNANIYSRRLIRLPEPKFVVFYNGKEKIPERYEMKLSDAYEKHTDNPALELKIDVLNINPGYNEDLLKRSPTLYQYMEFVSTVRKFQNKYSFDETMELAIDECVKNGILSDFLEKNRAEVLRMNIFEYDQEKHIKMEKEESLEEGIQIGEQNILMKQVGAKIKKGYTIDQIAELLEYPVDEIEPIYNMVRESADSYKVKKMASEDRNETEKDNN